MALAQRETTRISNFHSAEIEMLELWKLVLVVFANLVPTEKEVAAPVIICQLTETSVLVVVPAQPIASVVTQEYAH